MEFLAYLILIIVLGPIALVMLVNLVAVLLRFWWLVLLAVLVPAWYINGGVANVGAGLAIAGVIALAVLSKKDNGGEA